MELKNTIASQCKHPSCSMCHSSIYVYSSWTNGFTPCQINHVKTISGILTSTLAYHLKMEVWRMNRVYLLILYYLSTRTLGVPVHCRDILKLKLYFVMNAKCYMILKTMNCLALQVFNDIWALSALSWFIYILKLKEYLIVCLKSTSTNISAGFDVYEEGV